MIKDSIHIEEVDEIGPSAEYVEFKRVEYANGDVYEGECYVSSGKRHGEGLYTYANGETFEGMYANDLRVQGKMTYLDGSTYQGEWLTVIVGNNNNNNNNNEEGEEGEEQALEEGEGSCPRSPLVSGPSIRAGEATSTPQRQPPQPPPSSSSSRSWWGWLNIFSWGKDAKKKIKKNTCRAAQRGELGPRRYVMRDGTGEYVYPSGDKYSGQWRKNKKHGSGYFFQKETGACYSGQWRDGEINGHGRWTLADGSALEANFVNGAPAGTAIFIPGDEGRVVTGSFVRGSFIPTVESGSKGSGVNEEGDEKSEVSKNNQSKKYSFPKVDLDINGDEESEEEYESENESGSESEGVRKVNKTNGDDSSYNAPPPLSVDTFSSTNFDAESTTSSKSSPMKSSSSSSHSSCSSSSTTSSPPPPPPPPRLKKSKTETDTDEYSSSSSSSPPPPPPPLSYDDISEMSSTPPSFINGEEENDHNNLMGQIKLGVELRKIRDENGNLVDVNVAGGDGREVNEGDIFSHLKTAMEKRRTALNITNKGGNVPKNDNDDNSWSDKSSK